MEPWSRERKWEAGCRVPAEDIEDIGVLWQVWVNSGSEQKMITL